MSFIRNIDIDNRRPYLDHIIYIEIHFLDLPMVRGWNVSHELISKHFKQVFNVADAGLIMPPKSTWF